MQFSELGLKPEILRAIEDAGYAEPTPIQARAIPVILGGSDVLGIAQTGTGKTAGFTLPMIDALANGRARARMPRSLILEPTRELAAQVAENFEIYGKYERLNHALLIGGERFDEQSRKLDRGVDVLIATPGRMLDLFERGRVLLADVKVLVVDEADRMLDMGFIPDLERIVGLLPRTRQTLMFSATMPPEIRRLAEIFLDRPEEVMVDPPASAADLVAQHLVVVSEADKRAALRSLLSREQPTNALIFCNRKRDVEVVFKSLSRHGFDCGRLHGDMPQPARTATLEAFRQGSVRYLVCSDVAARGIDIVDLTHVFNFDVPLHPDDYVHRIGRTGRAGKAGSAYTIASPGDARFVDAITNAVKHVISRVTLDDVAEPTETAERDDAGTGRGRRSRRAAPAAAGERSREPVASAAPAARAGRTRGDERKERGGRGRRPADRDTEPAVVGFGDDVPAFMVRSGRPADRKRATP